MGTLGQYDAGERKK